jgi:DNA-directed RNA polymerase subunit RPC12/RpoP
MKIPVTCARCGKEYAVDEAFAGKRGKCATCGERMTIPGEIQAASRPPSEPDAYELDQVHASEEPALFSPAQGSESLSGPPPRRRAKKRIRGSSGRKRDEAASSHPALRGRATLIGLICVAVVLVLLTVFIPETRMNIGRVVAVAGLILFVYGYGSGAYIAFTEDGLYGWLYLLLPPYAAYYVVSRWDEMSSRLVMIIVGLALLAGGGRLLETGPTADAADKGAIARPE